MTDEDQPQGRVPEPEQASEEPDGAVEDPEGGDEREVRDHDALDPRGGDAGVSSSDASEGRQGEGEEEEEPPPELVCCRFSVAGIDFHIPIRSLVEIVEDSRITPLPLSPDYVPGIVSVRGTVVPVVDLAILRNAASTWSGQRRLVISEAGGEMLAFLVDGMPDLAYELGGEAVDVREFLQRYRVVMH